MRAYQGVIQLIATVEEKALQTNEHKLSFLRIPAHITILFH